MEWLRNLTGALDVELFSIGSRVVTPFHLVASVFVFVLTWCAALWIGSLCRRRLMRSIEEASRFTLIRMAQYGIWAAGILLGLRIWHIDLTAVAVTAGVLGVGIGFGLQGLIADFVAGLVLLFERPIGMNDFVTSDELEGRVDEISFRFTKIVTNDNISIIVPNSEFTNRTVINWSHADPRVRLKIPVAVAYGSNVDSVRDVLLDVARAEQRVLVDPEPEIRFSRFGESSLDFELLVWTDMPRRHRGLRSRLNFRIEAAFRAHGIEIPFPQRDLRIRALETLEPAGD